MASRTRTIVLYSDEKYFHHVVNTIESFRLVDEKFQFLYFQVGFSLPVFLYDMEVRCIRIDVSPEIPHMQLVKPTVLKEALNYCDHFVYVDCDALASRGFGYDKIIGKVKKFPYGPLLHETEWQRPVFYWQNSEVRYELDESQMMNYLGVKERTQPWVTTLLLAVDSSCLDFLIEWEDICNKRELWDGSSELEKMNMGDLPAHTLYFHMGDETPFNVLLWRGGASSYYEKYIILEPKEVLTFVSVENLKIKDTRIEKENPLTDVKDSENVYLYHQLKDLNFRIEILKNLYAQNK